MVWYTWNWSHCRGSRTLRFYSYGLVYLVRYFLNTCTDCSLPGRPGSVHLKNDCIQELHFRLEAADEWDFVRNQTLFLKLEIDAPRCRCGAKLELDAKGDWSRRVCRQSSCHREPLALRLMAVNAVYWDNTFRC